METPGAAFDRVTAQLAGSLSPTGREAMANLYRMRQANPDVAVYQGASDDVSIPPGMLAVKGELNQKLVDCMRKTGLIFRKRVSMDRPETEQQFLLLSDRINECDLDTATVEDLVDGTDLDPSDVVDIVKALAEIRNGLVQGKYSYWLAKKQEEWGKECSRAVSARFGWARVVAIKDFDDIDTLDVSSSETFRGTDFRGKKSTTGTLIGGTVLVLETPRQHTAQVADAECLSVPKAKGLMLRKVVVPYEVNDLTKDEAEDLEIRPFSKVFEAEALKRLAREAGVPTTKDNSRGTLLTLELALGMFPSWEAMQYVKKLLGEKTSASIQIPFVRLEPPTDIVDAANRVGELTRLWALRDDPEEYQRDSTYNPAVSEFLQARVPNGDSVYKFLALVINMIQNMRGKSILNVQQDEYNKIREGYYSALNRSKTNAVYREIESGTKKFKFGASRNKFLTDGNELLKRPLMTFWGTPMPARFSDNIDAKTPSTEEAYLSFVWIPSESSKELPAEFRSANVKLRITDYTDDVDEIPSYSDLKKEYETEAQRKKRAELGRNIERIINTAIEQKILTVDEKSMTVDLPGEQVEMDRTDGRREQVLKTTGWLTPISVKKRGKSFVLDMSRKDVIQYVRRWAEGLYNSALIAVTLNGVGSLKREDIDKKSTIFSRVSGKFALDNNIVSLTEFEVVPGLLWEHAESRTAIEEAKPNVFAAWWVDFKKENRPQVLDREANIMRALGVGSKADSAKGLASMVGASSKSKSIMDRSLRGLLKGGSTDPEDDDAQPDPDYEY